MPVTMTRTLPTHNSKQGTSGMIAQSMTKDRKGEFVDVIAHMHDLAKRQKNRKEEKIYEKALTKVRQCSESLYSVQDVTDRCKISGVVTKKLDKYAASSFNNGRVGLNNQAQSMYKETIVNEQRAQAKSLASRPRVREIAPTPEKKAPLNPYAHAVVISSPRLSGGCLDDYRPQDVTIKLRRQVTSGDSQEIEVEELQKFSWTPHAVGPAKILNFRDITPSRSGRASRMATPSGSRPVSRRSIRS